MNLVYYVIVTKPSCNANRTTIYRSGGLVCFIKGKFGCSIQTIGCISQEKRFMECRGVSMIIDDYNILMEVHKELQQEVLDLDNRLEDNFRRIKEHEIYLKDFIEPEDIKIFFPRTNEDIYGEEINRSLKEKAEYEKQNRELLQRREVLSERAKKLEKILKRENHKLTVLKIQEEDRQRIARDLHDTSLQNLTCLVHKIELSSMYIDTDPIQAKLELSVVNKYLRAVIDEIRGTIFNLRPMTFDDLGMREALERLLLNINENGEYEINSAIDDVSCETNLVMVSIYRIVQESLNNIVKHAEAKKIWFRIKEVNKRCIIDIEDDGKGFVQEKECDEKHFGISMMRERVELLNGNIAIHSEEGKGTKIHVVIPLLYS